MKNLVLFFTLIFGLGNFSAQQYFKISGLTITQINESQINTNLKIEELFGTAVYDSYMLQVNNNEITLKVCYKVFIFDGGNTVENDFLVDIPSNPDNYTLKVEVYPWGSSGCFQPQYMEDSASLNFTNPFSGTISLGISDPDSKNKNVSIYPNPVKDILQFSEEISNVKITDLSGKIVKQFSVSGKSIDVSTLSIGSYFITLTTKKGTIITKKLLKK